MREKGKHVRRLTVTEGLLFVVLWGGNEASEGGKGSRTRGGDEEEGDSGNSALAEARTSGSPAQSACRPGPPYQISCTIIRLMLLRRRPAHWKSNSDGTRLNTLQ